MNESLIFGGFGAVDIDFDGSLRALADKLSVALNIRGVFNVETDEYPPHREIGTAGVLGCQIWLENDSAHSGLFRLRIETSHAVDEVVHGRMHDLSPWLARFLVMMCDLAVRPTVYDSSS